MLTCSESHTTLSGRVTLSMSTGGKLLRARSSCCRWDCGRISSSSIRRLALSTRTILSWYTAELSSNVANMDFMMRDIQIIMTIVVTISIRFETSGEGTRNWLLSQESALHGAAKATQKNVKVRQLMREVHMCCG